MVDAESLSECALLHATIDEGQRLDGLNLGIVRRTRRRLDIDGCSIPAGTIVNAQVRHRHLDPDLFEAPERFCPEHFLGARLPPDDFAPFGGGYRRCLGAPFATFELQVLLATIVRRVQLRAPPGLLVNRAQHGAFPGPSNEIPLQVL